MHLTVPQITRSAATIRSTARLVTDTENIEIWFEGPASWPIDPTCAPFVPVATLLANAGGAASVVVDGAIPDPLLAGARQASSIIAAHFGRGVASIEAETRPPPVVSDVGQKVGLFLSRGVDSSANLVLADQGHLDPRPDTAIMLAGIEPANTPDLDARLTDESVRAAATFGLESVVVRSNLRDVIDRRMWWIEGFGTVLAGAGLLLSGRLSDAIISSASPKQRTYTGSHPDIDPLWGNGVVSFHHLPEQLTRSERVRLIVEDGRPLEFLRVCGSGEDRNCGRCQKCKQTVVLIRAFGGDPTPVFDDTDVSAEDLRTDGPGQILRPDFIDAAPPELAAAAAERADAADHHAASSALHEAATAEPNGSTEWLVIGDSGRATAALVEAAHACGRGTVLTEGPALTTHVLRAAAAQASVTMWPSLDPATDGLRAIECLRSGSRPLIVHSLSTRDAARARLPATVEDLIGSVSDVSVALDRAGDDMPRLATQLAGGGLGWVQA